jgi:hypothetical protein
MVLVHIMNINKFEFPLKLKFKKKVHIFFSNDSKRPTGLSGWAFAV